MIRVRHIHWVAVSNTKSDTTLIQSRAMNADTFGAWIKQRRKKLDLTQEGLAQQIGCSISAIRKIESDQRRPSKQIAELLALHLEVPPEERTLFLKIAHGEGSIQRLNNASTPTEKLVAEF